MIYCLEDDADIRELELYTLYAYRQTNRPGVGCL